MWDPNPFYKGKRCLVCGKPALSRLCPLGIASGSFPCHPQHTDREIRTAYFNWFAAMFPELIEASADDK